MAHAHSSVERCTEDLRERIPRKLLAMHVVAKDAGMQISEVLRFSVSETQLKSILSSTSFQIPTRCHYLQQNLKLKSVMAGEGDVVEQLLKPGGLPLKV